MPADLKPRALTFPVCTIVGVEEFGMEGETGFEGVTPRPASDIPSPAAGFRRRALFQEAASRQSRASLASSAISITRSGPFEPTAPLQFFEAELRTAIAMTMPTGLADTRSQPLQ
jgi:hypothetical protein